MRDPLRADRAEILRAVTLIAAPGQVVELRALNVKARGGSYAMTMSGYFDDLELLADAAAGLRGAQGIYITLNPPDPAVLARSPNRLQPARAGGSTSDSDIRARRWLPVDTDPRRPADVSASDAEHEAALAAARQIRETLTSLGWPAPLLADSGNGGHLLYRIDLPRDDRGLVGRVLAALALLFDDEQVQIDQRVYNPGRIWKLYGTVARKGKTTEERPHRLARLLEAPEELIPVPPELLERFAARSDKLLAISHKLSATSRKLSTASYQPSSFSLDSWLAEHAVPVSGPHPWGDGGRCWVFRICPWNRTHRRSAYIVQLPNGAIAAGCHHNSCIDKGWRDVKAIYDSRKSETSKPKGEIGNRKSVPGPRAAGGSSLSSVPPRPGPDGTAQAGQATPRDPGKIEDAPSAASNRESRIVNHFLSELSSWPRARDRAGVVKLEAHAVTLAEAAAGLSRADLLRIVTALRGLGCRGAFLQQWLAAVRERRRSLPAADEAAAGVIYEADDGRIYRLTYEITSAGEPQPRREVVADFALHIAEEIVAEDGRVWFALEGQAADGRPLRAELPAADFADDRALQAAVTEAAGPRCPVRAGMIRHLRPAIQLLTAAEVPRVRRFDRTGWAELGIRDRGSGIEGDYFGETARSRRPPMGNDAGAGDCFAKNARNDAANVAPVTARSGVSDEAVSTSLESRTLSAGRLRVFLLPGREPPGVVVRLPRKLPYRCDPQADLAQGLVALEAALEAVDPARTTVLAAAILGAPLARLAGLDGERYGIFVAGRTGSLKTSTVQALMCVYGAGFIEDACLLKLGEGATRNAIMGYAARVHDLPLMIDNYKPSTGDGVRGFVNLLHNLLEGGERDRMTRTAELREARPIHCWPVFTGEDVPDADTAGLARVLVVPFEPPQADENPALSRAQALAAHLPAVGEAWLAWLEGSAGDAPRSRTPGRGPGETERRGDGERERHEHAETGREGDGELDGVPRESPASLQVGVEIRARFPAVRARWRRKLRALGRDMVNPLRVASSLAMNELAWWALCRHPELGPLAQRYAVAHEHGLALVAAEMARRTAVSLEAARFLAVLRELLVTGRLELIARSMNEAADLAQKGGRTPVGNDAAGNSRRREPGPGEDSPRTGRPGRGRMTPKGSDAGAIPERVLGWECPDGSVYLLPELARREVERVLGPGGLNAISSRTLHEQLSELGLIASHDPNRFTRKIREAGRTHNVLHLLPDALEG